MTAVLAISMWLGVALFFVALVHGADDGDD